MTKSLLYAYTMLLVANQNLKPSSYFLSLIFWTVVNLSRTFLTSRWISLVTEEGLSPWRLAFLSCHMAYRAAWNTYRRVNLCILYCSFCRNELKDFQPFGCVLLSQKLCCKSFPYCCWKRTLKKYILSCLDRLPT